MDYEITVGDYSTEEKIAQLRVLFDASYGVDKAVKLSSEFIKWQYLDNPNGKVVSFNAWSKEGEMAGHCATIPVKMMLEGKEVKGLLSLNTAIQPHIQNIRARVCLPSWQTQPTNMPRRMDIGS